jgi:hypothetical protein
VTLPSGWRWTCQPVCLARWQRADSRCRFQAAVGPAGHGWAWSRWVRVELQPGPEQRRSRTSTSRASRADGSCCGSARSTTVVGCSWSRSSDCSCSQQPSLSRRVGQPPARPLDPTSPTPPARTDDPGGRGQVRSGGRNWGRPALSGRTHATTPPRRRQHPTRRRPARHVGPYARQDSTSTSAAPDKPPVRPPAPTPEGVVRSAAPDKAPSRPPCRAGPTLQGGRHVRTARRAAR